MEFKVTIENFDGPLDLMLHLIKEKELDIFNLDIAILTDQYIAFIHQMEELQLDIASEYLAELAGLIELKSKKLLPNDKSEIEDNYEEEKENDLIKRLIEYKKYKEVSQQFEILYRERELLHDKPASVIQLDNNDESVTYNNADAYVLIKTMNRLLERYKISQPYEVSIQQKRISLDERMSQIKDIVKRKYNKKTFTLKDSMEDCQDAYDVVMTFLSLLSLINDKYLNFTIEKDEIYFRRSA